MPRAALCSTMVSTSRLWTLAFLAATVIAGALPVWWFTTRVHRAELPESSIAAAAARAQRWRWRTRVAICHRGDVDVDVADVAAAVRRIVDERAVVKAKADFVYQWLVDAEDKCPPTADAGGEADVRFVLTPVPEGPDAVSEVYMGTEREARVHVRHTDADAVGGLVARALLALFRHPADVCPQCEAMRLPTADAYRLAFHRVVARPTGESLADGVWDFDGEYVRPYLARLVERLAALATVDLTSAVHFLPGGDDVLPAGARLSLEEQKNLVNQLGLNLDSSTAAVTPTDPLVHLLVLDAARAGNASDASLAGSQLNAFVLPRWGGVQLRKADARQEAAVFVAQLRQLLGVPDYLVGTTDDGRAPAFVASAGGLAAWEADNLMRLRTLEHVRATTRILATLLRLVG